MSSRPRRSYSVSGAPPSILSCHTSYLQIGLPAATQLHPIWSQFVDLSLISWERPPGLPMLLVSLEPSQAGREHGRCDLCGYRQLVRRGSLRSLAANTPASHAAAFVQRRFEGLDLIAGRVAGDLSWRRRLPRHQRLTGGIAAVMNGWRPPRVNVLPGNGCVAVMPIGLAGQDRRNASACSPRSIPTWTPGWHARYGRAIAIRPLFAARSAVRATGSTLHP